MLFLGPFPNDIKIPTAYRYIDKHDLQSSFATEKLKRIHVLNVFQDKDIFLGL